MRAPTIAGLTRWPLPDGDASVDRLGDEDRRTIAAMWLGRACAEGRAAFSFQVIAEALAARDAEPELRAVAVRAVDDERRHAEICRRVASAYAGRELEQPSPESVQPPEHAGADASLRATLHVVGMCAINETTGSAFLETCRARATGRLVRAAFRELLADEVDHARIGWAHLASPRVGAEGRAGVGAWLPAMLAANLRQWRNRPPLPARATLAAHGCLSWAEVDAAVLGAMRELILPGFEHVGVDVTGARAWFEAGAPI
jgi:hypothetical protein